METEILYLPSAEANYIREFDARVVDHGEDWVALDRTAFYAEGGGQPDDRGWLRWPGGETRVRKVRKEKGVVKHYVSEVPAAEDVHGVIDWDRRYPHMRMHTSQHVLSGMVYKLHEAKTVGNQIHAERSRVDFRPVTFTEEDLRRLETECNAVLETGVDVEIFEADRGALEEAMGGKRYILDMVPQSIRHLRVVKLGDFDQCPCGGTHVRNLGEIGRMRILGRRSKGRDTDRIEYELEQPRSDGGDP
jgi:misacylated tRNA(Ala) deacylase